MIQNVNCSQSSSMPGQNLETVTADVTPPSAGATGQPQATLKNKTTGQVVGMQAMTLVAGSTSHYSATFMVGPGQYCAIVSVTWIVITQVPEQSACCDCA